MSLEGVSKGYPENDVLDGVSLGISAGDRIGVIGRNGSGKSTLLRIIEGTEDIDDGTIIRSRGLRVAALNQNPVFDDESTVGHVLNDDRQAIALADKLGLTEPDVVCSTLSGGQRKRLALAVALSTECDLLILDEPTNHLDIATIKWLEDRIYVYPGAVLFITHDRAFLQRLATRIVEIDRGKLTSWPGNYANYLLLKEKSLEDESAANARFDKKMEQEEEWIRQGIKARRTRNEGRVRSLQKMREEFAGRIKQDGKASIHIEDAEQSGRKVIRARNISYSYDNNAVISNFSVKIMRGDRIGLIGNNGVGKTTLLRLLLGELEPQTGTLKRGTNLEVGYFDQLRQALELDKSVAYNVGEGRTYININGKDRHIVGYLKGFLFTPKRSMTPVKSLSGGERNRVILAKLFTRPANLLVLDEPTNDLDIETLEVLEQKLCNYSGTLIVVSHDRDFLDNVVTSTIVFEDDGKVQEYVGGYTDWQRQGHQLAVTDRQQEPAVKAREDSVRRKNRKKTKLSYKNQRERDQLPAAIESLEASVAALQVVISKPDFYSQGDDAVQRTLAQLSATESSLEQHVERWVELESEHDSLLSN